MLATVFLLMHCSGTQTVNSGRLSSGANESGKGTYLAPSSRYAAEILSYMMQVVVGAAGDSANRQAWKSKSLSVDLELDQVSTIMEDRERNVSELMVYDANILGLSKVLFHYNQRLNYFKGRRFQESLYPSEELLAIRLFIVQKIARGEKARMGNLMSESALLEDPLTEPSLVALAMVNLNADELRLLQDVIHSEPFFKDYLEDPFLVEALHRVGIVEMDGYVKSKVEAADYSRLAAEYIREARPDNVVRVAILPSLTRSFDVQAQADADFPLGFRANDDYVLAVETLKAKLAAAIQHRLADALDGEEGDSLSLAEKDKKAADMVNTHLQFLDFDKRPLVIYPENADKVIQSLCPDADFNFIILGKNVYLSMYIDAERDVFPSVNRIYFDIMDIGQTQSDYEIDQVGDYLFNLIKSFIS